MKSLLYSCRTKLGLLIVGLVLATALAAIIPMLIFGKGALIEIGRAESRLTESALFDEWENSSVANTKLLAHNLEVSLSLADSAALNKLAGSARSDSDVVYVYVLDRNGVVVADGTDGADAIGRVLPGAPGEENIGGRNIWLKKTGSLVEVTALIRHYGDRLGAVRVGYSPKRIQAIGAVLNRQARDAVNQAGGRTILILISAVSVAGIVLLVFGLFFARSMSAPLLALVEATRSFGAGHLATRVNLPPRNDEIGELAASFDDMMDHIEDHATGLERLVEQRTRDLRESELRLRSIMDHADAVVTLKDLDGRFLMVNREFAKRQGITQEEAIGKRLQDLYPDGNFAPIDGYEREVIETGRAVQGEFAALSDPESGVRLTTKFPVRNSSGEIVAVGTINTDITEIKRTQKELLAARDELEARVEERTRELRESEERYRQLINVSPDGIMVHSDDVIVFANPTFVKLLGADSANQLIGRDAIEFVPEEDREAVLERRRNAAERMTLSPRETAYQRLDGALVPVERTLARITWQGKPAFLVLTRDITERKQRDAELQQAQKMEAVGQLTGGIAHDFNNLLTVILGYFELRDGAAANPDMLERMGNMANIAARKGADLTQRLLAFARRQPLRPRPVDLSVLVEGMKELISRSIGEAITIETACDEDMWQCIVDAAQLENALLNLCLNARDAMSDGGKLLVQTRNVELDAPSARRIGDLTAGRYVVMSVIDDGHGMTREVAAKVIEPFFTTKTEERGTGLGLSMVYGFVRQSGGDVRIVSAPDAGATIELYLPASDSESELSPQDSSPHSGSEPPTTVHGTEKILMVEDDPAVRELGVTMLTTLGYDVIEAADGPSALALLERDDTVDLMFTDVVMPGGMHGSELARRARELRPEIRVVLTSGYPQDDQDSIELGSDELLAKPYSNVQLASTIRRILDH